MAYKINRWSGPEIASVNDGTVNESLDVKLIGKNYAGYGEIQNENITHLLENFAGPIEPPKAISGQLWYNSTEKRVKVYTGDITGAGTKVWKSLGGADVGTTEPQFAKQGDLWLDTFKSQLKVRTATNSWLTIGPQSAGTSTTQMVSRDVNGVPFTGGDIISYPIIAATVNDEVVYVISKNEFILDNSDPDSNIPGFTRIKKGITLAYTNASGQNTQIDEDTPSNIFWGTTSYALKANDANSLNGFTADQFVRSSSANFSVKANFADVGLTVGNEDNFAVYLKEDADPTDPDLKVPVLAATGLNLEFNLRHAHSTLNPIVPLRLDQFGLIPGESNAFNLGSTTRRWTTVYAGRFDGTSTVAERLVYGATTVTGADTATGSTIAIRDANGNLYASNFYGVAETAAALKVGTTNFTGAVAATNNTIAIRGSDGSVKATLFDGVCLTARNIEFNGNAVPAKTSADPTSIVIRDVSGAITAAGFNGSGAGLSQLNASSLSSGTVPSARLSGSYAISITGTANTATTATTAENANKLRVAAGDYRTTSVTSLAGTIPVRDTSGELRAEKFIGSGSDLTQLNAGALASGTVPTGRLTGSYNIDISGTAATATNANNLSVAGTYRTASVSADNDTIAVRDSAGDLTANTFKGNATSATYATNLRVGTFDRAGSTAADGNTVAVRNDTGDLYANIYYGTAQYARYADLAENYLADAEYEVGTVVAVGGEAEVTASTAGDRAIGVVSAKPAYLMNSELAGGTAIALKGRVPVKVTGPVKKGNRLVAFDNGTARAVTSHMDVFAIALESSDDQGVKLIEAIIL